MANGKLLLVFKPRSNGEPVAAVADKTGSHHKLYTHCLLPKYNDIATHYFCTLSGFYCPVDLHHAIGDDRFCFTAAAHDALKLENFVELNWLPVNFNVSHLLCDPLYLYASLMGVTLLQLQTLLAVVDSLGDCH